MIADSLSGRFTATDALRQVFEDPDAHPQRIVLRRDQQVYQPADPAEHVFYVTRGQVRLFHTPAGGDRLIGILGPGDWFGCVALARGSRLTHRAVVAAPTILIRSHAERFLEALARHPAATIELSRNLAQKVMCAHEDAAGLIFEDCTERLVKTLLRFSTSAAAQRIPEGVVVRVTHEQLAQAIGVARETVSVTLTQLRQQQLVQTGRNRLTFDPANLAGFLHHRSRPVRLDPVN